MKYIFSDGIDLCGWKKLPYALRDRRNGKKAQIIWLNEHLFELFKLCDGKLDFDMMFFSDEDRKALNESWKYGYIKECRNNDSHNEVKYTFYNNRYIRTVHWSITGKCNSKCRHCYMSAPDAKLGELDHETIFKLIDEYGKAGVSSVTLTGGECLVRNDFLEIVDKLLDNNIFIDTIYTNGYLVNDKLLTELKNRKIFPEFNMSFDGVGYHDWMRGVKGAEKMTSDALKLCHEYGFPTGTEMCLFKTNKHTLRETINYLSSLGVRSIKTNPVSKTEFWEKYGEGNDISKEELYDIYLDYIPYYYKDGKPMDIMLGGFFSADRDSNEYFVPVYKKVQNLDKTCVCSHARLIMYVSPEGRALPCMSLSSCDIQNKFPIIQDIGMSKCLDDSFYMEFIDKTATEIINHNERCKECEYKKNCFGGCRAAGYDCSKDLLGIDEYACSIFKNGYIQKIKDIVSKVDPNAKLIL